MDEYDPVAAKLHGTTDAQVWAREFMALWHERVGFVNEGTMIAWFANAIETGRAAGVRSVDESFRRVAEAWERVTGGPLSGPGDETDGA